MLRELLTEHKMLFGWLTAASLIAFVGTLLIIPVLVARMPHDYFVRRRKLLSRTGEKSGIGRWTFHIIKNAFGVTFLAAGIAMLVLPGQGILTMLVGLMCMDFPGKRRFELTLARRPGVLAAINWIRTRSGNGPLLMPHHDDHGDADHDD